MLVYPIYGKLWVRQLGLLSPIYGRQKSKPPTSYLYVGAFLEKRNEPSLGVSSACSWENSWFGNKHVGKQGGWICTQISNRIPRPHHFWLIETNVSSLLIQLVLQFQTKWWGDLLKHGDSVLESAGDSVAFNNNKTCLGMLRSKNTSIIVKLAKCCLTWLGTFCCWFSVWTLFIYPPSNLDKTRKTGSGKTFGDWHLHPLDRVGKFSGMHSLMNTQQ